MIADYLTLATLAYLLPLDIMRLFMQRGINFCRKVGFLTYLIAGLFWALAAVFIIINGNFFRALKLGWSHNLFIQFMGLFLLCASLGWLVWSVMTLGPKTTLVVPEVLPAKQKVDLVIKGPFRLVRHPIYLGELTFLVSMILITQAASLALLLAFKLILTFPITFWEERELMDRFGQKYKNYQKTVPWIFPRIKKVDIKHINSWLLKVTIL